MRFVKILLRKEDVVEVVYSTIGLFLANASLIVWFRSESRADWRHMDTKVDAIHAEMKDFHNRLCEIEAGKKDKEKKG